VINSLTKSKFLQNESERSAEHQNFKVDFDWIFKEQNFTKILEGKYFDTVITEKFTNVNTSDNNGFNEKKEEYKRPVYDPEI
jgi:hypothetical protein